MRRRTMMQETAVTRRYFEEEELLTEDKVFDGGFITDSDGTVYEYADWSYTDYIKVDKDDIILIKTSASSAKYNAFYDSNNNRISALAVPIINTSYFILEIPENAKYIRMSWSNNSPITTIKRITLT